MLARKGYLLDFASEQSPHIQQQRQIRTLTIAVYAHRPNKKHCNYKAIFEPVKQPGSGSDCEQTQLGLGLGGIIALVFTGIGGMCLPSRFLNRLSKVFSG